MKFYDVDCLRDALIIKICDKKFDDRLKINRLLIAKKRRFDLDVLKLVSEPTPRARNLHTLWRNYNTKGALTSK